MCTLQNRCWWSVVEMLLFHIIVVHTLWSSQKRFHTISSNTSSSTTSWGVGLLSSLSHSSLTIDPEAPASSHRHFACSRRAYGTMLGCDTASCFNHNIYITTYSISLHTMSHLNTINLHLTCLNPFSIHRDVIQGNSTRSYNASLTSTRGVHS